MICHQASWNLTQPKADIDLTKNQVRDDVTASVLIRASSEFMVCAEWSRDGRGFLLWGLLPC